MRLTTYLLDQQPRLAVVDGDAIIDLANANPGMPHELRAALAAGVDLMARSMIASPSTTARRGCWSSR